MQSDRISLQIAVDAPVIQFKGVGIDVEPDTLSGHVSLNLTEDTAVKQILLSFKGKAVVPADLDAATFSRFTTSTFFSHDWQFLKGDRSSLRTLRAGLHSFPFRLDLPASLPSSINTTTLGEASISYELNAQVLRSAFSYNVHATAPVTILRSLGQEALEYQQTLDIEGAWPDKVMYSCMIPHKAWAAGDNLTAIIKLSPLCKDIRLLKIVTTIRESTRFHGAHSREHMRVVSMAKHEIVNGRAVPLSSSDQGSHDRSGATSPSHSSLAGNRDWVEDITTSLSIALPLHITPTHTLDPITVSHRIQWGVLIQNPDGHTSELRCSLPLHLLDNRLLEESKRFTAPIRQIVLGGAEGLLEAMSGLIPPSYPAHVHDPLVNSLSPGHVSCRCTCSHPVGSPKGETTSLEHDSTPIPSRDVPSSPTICASCQQPIIDSPGYEVSTRCFAGTVPPLESMRGLPSYEGIQRPQGSEATKDSEGGYADESVYPEKD
ncbi:hypothetical protein AX16_005324 [Volvariella volvacea WC 439]|nr:hypothetical protein AX16_005324 [Volvariella volvacea WC 439]